MARWVAIVAAAGAAVSGMVRAQPLEAPATVCDGRTVRAIAVEGTRRVEPDDVRAAISLRRGEVCTDEAVQADARTLWALDLFEDVAIEAVREGEEVDLRITLVERPSLRHVRFEGNDELDDDELDEQVTLDEGDVITETEVARQVIRIRDAYAEEGHYLARVDYELVAVEDAPAPEMDVRFTIREGPRVRVRSIRFAGNRHLRSRDLEQAMQSSETGFFSFLTKNDVYRPDNLDDDTIRLAALYYDHGYLAVEVADPDVRLSSDHRHVDITIRITEGPRFRVRDVSVAELDAEGNEIEPLFPRDDLVRTLDARRGDWFSRSRIGTGVQEITRRYRDRGYASVVVRPETPLDVEGRTVDLVLRIERGPPVTIERIEIRGNDKTRDAVIRRELTLVEGELYSQTELEESRRNVQALGYFERVDVSEEEGSAPDRMVVTFQVAERSTGNFNAGLGFSAIDSAFLLFNFSQANVRGLGWDAAASLNLSFRQQSFQLRFMEPRLFGSQWSLGFEAGNQSRQYGDFRRLTGGGSIALGHPLWDDRLRLELRYRLEWIRIDAATGSRFGSGAGSDIFDSVPISGLHRSGRTSSFRLALSFDTRDNRLLPTEGIFAYLSTEVADRATGSENVFLRTEAGVRGYHQLLPWLQLRANFQFGLITSRRGSGVPLFERYYLGGAYDVRGFDLNGVGPRLGIPRSYDPLGAPDFNGTAVGGNLMAHYSLELEVPILRDLGLRGVVFTDGGNVWNTEERLCGGPAYGTESAFDPCGAFSMRFSWGFGVRWMLPIGLLRLEFGLPFRPRRGEEALQFHFAIGGTF